MNRRFFTAIFTLVSLLNPLQGGGEWVLGQNLPAWGPSSTATVDVFNPILSNDIYSPVVTDAQNTTSVTIHTELVYREVFITEVVYNPGDYANFVYPFGRQMEITTTNAFSSFNLNDYSLIFYRVCDATHYVQNIYPLANLHCYLSLTNLANITTVNAQTAFIVDVPSLVELNASATLTNCADNSQQLIIALVKNPIGASNIKLLNLIGVNISDNIGVNTNGSIADSFDANTYKPVKIVNNALLLDNSIGATSWYLTVNSWQYYPNNPTPLGVLNNVVTCNYYIPKYYFTDLPSGTPYYHQFCVIPNQKNPGQTNANYEIGTSGKEHFLPAQLSTQMYYSCNNTAWNQNITCQTATQPGVPGGWSNTLPNHERNVLTMHYAAEKGFDYFKNVHGLTNWLSNFPNYSYHLEKTWAKQKIYDAFLYVPNQTDMVLGALGTAILEISQGLGTVSGVGHELGHNFISLKQPNGTWTHEGFADIWGTCIEKYAFSLLKPQYLILTTSAGINRSLKSDIMSVTGTGTNTETYHVVYNGYIYYQSNYHSKGRLLGNWFYLLSEGEGKMLLNEKMSDASRKNIPKYVCGIGDALAARIVFKMLDHIHSSYESPLDGNNNLIAESLLAVDVLAAVPSEVITYPELQNTEYVKAQIRNAWAAVNFISDPDFDINNNNATLSTFDENTLTICPGQTLNLTASGYGTEIWRRNGTVISSNGDLVIPNISVANSGIYQVTETYTSPTGAVCGKTRSVNVVVEDILITANQNPICAGSNLILTAIHGNVQANSVVWSKNGNTLVTQDSPYQITNIQPSNAGIYTVNANCITPSGAVVPISAQITITVIAAPATSSIEIGTVQGETNVPGNITICQGQQLRLYATGGNVYWTETSQDANIMLVSPTTTTTYHAQVCNTSCAALCTTATITVTVNALPTAAITGSNLVCQNTPTTLTASGGINYAWSNGVNNLSMSPPTTAVGTTTYTVTITNAAGCIATATKTVNTLAVPTATITQSASTGCSVLLTATATGATSPYTYNWMDNSSGSTILATTANNYQVVATANNGCAGIANLSLTYNQIAPVDFDGTYTVGAMGAASFATPDLDGNEIWTALNKRFAGTIIVPAGKTLTLQNTSIEMVTPNTKILIEPDGRLNLNSSTLRGDACNNNFWSGIEVQGLDIPYTTVDFETLDATHNYGALRSDLSSIRDALVAINNGVGIRAGGILYLSGTIFEDNDVAVRLSPLTFSTAQPHTITNCSFNMVRNTPHAATWWATDVNQPIGIWAKGAKLLNTWSNNRFISTMVATTTLDKRGIGMRLDNVQIKIDATPETDPAAPTTYEFEGLFKGIDAANLTTVQKYISLQNQNFRNTRKAATFANTYGSTISQCSFEVPAGSSNIADTYGLLCQASQGFEVSSNRFTTTANNAYTRGAIFYKANQTGFASSLKNNLFDGAFSAATQFQNDNTKLKTNCNAYDDCQADWHLTNNANLPEQGLCNGDPNVALRTHWHYTTELGNPLPYTNSQIINDNSLFELKLNIDNSPQSEPTVFGGIGLISPFFCSIITGVGIYNTSCTVTFPTEGAGLAAGDCDGDVEKRIYTYMREDKRDSLLALLHCVNTEWAIKVLVGTYVDEKQYDIALIELQKLDTTKTDNIEFIALYNAIMDGSFDPNAGGRMAITANTQRIANNPQSENKTLAETALALFRDTEYVRYGVPTKQNTANQLSDNTNFKLIPNPAQDIVTIQLLQPINSTSDLLLYDISGRLVSTIKNAYNGMPINVQYLQTGMYYCRLLGDNKTEKLVIIR